MNDIDEIEPFTFKSTFHQRFEEGEPTMGLQLHTRTITVEKNTEGCPGYLLEPGIGYIVKIFNDEFGTPQMTDKPMIVIQKSDDSVELRGFPIDAMTPFGWMEIDNSDYGLTVAYEDGEVDYCILHMFDRKVDILYGGIE